MRERKEGVKEKKEGAGDREEWMEEREAWEEWVEEGSMRGLVEDVIGQNMFVFVGPEAPPPGTSCSRCRRCTDKACLPTPLCSPVHLLHLGHLLQQLGRVEIE